MTNLPGNLERILGYASLAPNPHNCQPWQVKVLPEAGDTGAQLVVQSDSTRWLPHSDPTNRELLISIGSFWENLEQAATALGYEAQTEIVAAKTTDTDILKVKLLESRETNPPSAESLKLMENRYTNRMKFKKDPILPSHLEECLAVLPGNLAYYPRESDQGKWIAANEPEAMRQQVFHDGKQSEMAEWTRFSLSGAIERGDGTTAEMAGFSGITKFFWYHFMSPKHLLTKNVRNNTVTWMKRRVTHCAGFFALTSEDTTVPALLEAGRAYQRFALKCVQLNIQVSPMCQLVNEAPWNQRISDELGLTKPVQVVICAGYSNNFPNPLIRIRRPVKDFVRGETLQEGG